MSHPKNKAQHGEKAAHPSAHKIPSSWLLLPIIYPFSRNITNAQHGVSTNGVVCGKE
jgi:hypothetical protein